MKILLSMILLVPCISFAAKQIKVAVIDSGISKTIPNHCKSPQNFTQKLMKDQAEHGDNVVGLINKHAGLDGKHCILFYKFYDPEEENNVNQVVNSVLMAIRDKADVINISGGGYGYNKAEHAAIRLALKRGIRVVAAAGNDRKNLLMNPYYPAMYDPRIFVIACKNRRYSNYGLGVDATLNCDKKGNPKMSGTSQGTAIFTGELVKGMKREKKNTNIAK